jgi:hypothetical protein
MEVARKLWKTKKRFESLRESSGKPTKGLKASDNSLENQQKV